MDDAIDKLPELKNDEEAKIKMKKYFAYTAHYIVAAKDYMRSDQVSHFCGVCTHTKTNVQLAFIIYHYIVHLYNQLSGGTKIDSGRIW